MDLPLPCCTLSLNGFVCLLWVESFPIIDVCLSTLASKTLLSLIITVLYCHSPLIAKKSEAPVL